MNIFTGGQIRYNYRPVDGMEPWGVVVISTGGEFHISKAPLASQYYNSITMPKDGTIIEAIYAGTTEEGAMEMEEFTGRLNSRIMDLNNLNELFVDPSHLESLAQLSA